MSTSQIKKTNDYSITLTLFCKNLFCFLLIIFCSQGLTFELSATHLPIHESIQNYEVEQEVDKLLLLIQKRLVIMHEVARTKWNQNLAIEDKSREQLILADLTAKANQFGLDEKFVSRFFEAQIEASKEIQKNDFILWKTNSVTKFDRVFSLKDELRLYIDQLNNEMFAALSKIYTKTYDKSVNYILDQPISTRNSDHVENDIWFSATSPLKNNQ